MKSIKLILIALSLSLAGCTQNERTRSFGGSMVVQVPEGKTVVNMTWRADSSLWVQYRDRLPTEKPSTTTFKEYSSFGLMEGEVTVTEK